MRQNTLMKKGIATRSGDRSKFKRSRPHPCGKFGQSVQKTVGYLIEAFGSTVLPSVASNNIRMVVRGAHQPNKIPQYGEVGEREMNDQNEREGKNITFNQVTNYNVFKEQQKHQSVDYATIYSNSMKRYRRTQPTINHQQPAISSNVSQHNDPVDSQPFSFQNSSKMQQPIEPKNSQPGPSQESNLGKRKIHTDSSDDSESQGSIQIEPVKTKKKRRRVHVDFDVQKLFDSKKLEESLSNAMENRIEKTVFMIEKKLSKKMTNQFSKMWEKAIDSFQDKLRETNEQMSQRSRSNLSRGPSDKVSPHAINRSVNGRPRSTSPQIGGCLINQNKPKNQQRSRSNSSQKDRHSTINVEQNQVVESPKKNVDIDKPFFGQTEQKVSKKSEVTAILVDEGNHSQPIPLSVNQIDTQQQIFVESGKKIEKDDEQSNMIPTQSIIETPMEPIPEIVVEKANPFINKDSLKNNPFFSKKPVKATVDVPNSQESLFGAKDRGPLPSLSKGQENPTVCESKPQGLFGGNPSPPLQTTSPAAPGGLFGAKPPPSGLFGAAGESVPQQQAPGLFAAPPTAGGLFGTKPVGSGLFAQAPKSGLFSTPSPGGLFGPAQQQTQGSSGLFGQQHQQMQGQQQQRSQKSSGKFQTEGLFGNAKKAPVQNDGLFDA